MRLYQRKKEKRLLTAEYAEIAEKRSKHSTAEIAENAEEWHISLSGYSAVTAPKQVFHVKNVGPRRSTALNPLDRGNFFLGILGDEMPLSYTPQR